MKRRRKDGIGSKADDVSEMPPPPAQAQMEEREFIPPINEEEEEEEEEENDSLLPVQENPWVDMVRIKKIIIIIITFLWESSV